MYSGILCNININDQLLQIITNSDIFETNYPMTYRDDTCEIATLILAHDESPTQFIHSFPHQLTTAPTAIIMQRQIMRAVANNQNVSLATKIEKKKNERNLTV